MSKNNFAEQAILEYLKGSGSNSKTNFNTLSNQYQNIVKEPTSSDASGDNLAQFAKDLPANNPGQQYAKAGAYGAAAGAKGYANDQRSSKLKGLEQQTASLLEQNAVLEQQMADDSVNREKIKQVFKQSSVNIAELSKAAMAGDTSATNSLAQNVLRTYKRITNDKSVGEFDHYNNGTIYYENPETGNIEGRNIIDSMYQSGINPVEVWGQDAAAIEAGLSPGAAKNYKNTEEERALKLREVQSNIGVNQAHSNLYNAQADKATAEANAAPPKYREKVADNIQIKNHEWIKETKDEERIIDKNIKAYEIIQTAIQDELKRGKNTVGPSIFNQAARIREMQDGDSKNQAIIELARQPVFSNLKKLFGSVVSNTDLIKFLETEPGLNQSPEATLPALKRKIYDLKRDVTENNIRRKVVEQDFQFSEPAHSLIVDNKVKQELQQYDAQNPNPDTQTNQETSGVIATDPETGEQQRISSDKVEEAKKRGLIVE